MTKVLTINTNVSFIPGLRHLYKFVIKLHYNMANYRTPKPTKELTALSKQINTLVDEYNKTAKESIVFSLATLKSQLS
jgi:hypothetical protein